MPQVTNDGLQIAYQVHGRGRGAGFLFAQTKVGWDRMGYVRLLTERGRRVVVVDPRGYGDSSRDRHGESYSLDAHCDDLLCAADAAGLDEFVAWGYSNTAALALALAARTDRAVAVACCGMDPFMDFTAFRDHITDEVADVGEGAYDPEGSFDWRSAAAFYRGYTAWQPVGLGDRFRCPGVVVYGTADDAIRPSIEANRSRIDALGFEVRSLPDLDHRQCVEQADLVVATVLGALPSIGVVW